MRKEMIKSSQIEVVILLMSAFIFTANAVNSTLPEKNVSNYSNDKYRIVHITEIVRSTNEYDDKNPVITYQQQNINGIDNTSNDTRLLEIVSKGFDENPSEIYITISQFKDFCKEQSTFPSWKIDRGTENGIFRLKISYQEQISEKDLYLCLYNGQYENMLIHLGRLSLFRLERYELSY